MYDRTKDAKDFFATNSKLNTPHYNSLNERKNKITNTVKYDPTVYENPENSLAWVPLWRNKNKIGQNISDNYWKGEEFLNQEEFDNSLDALFAASFNRFRGTPANVLSDSFDMIADCVDELDEDKKSDFTDWLRSMEDNSEMLNKSERQYSQVCKDNEFVNGLITGISKELVDMGSRAFIGGMVNIPTEALSAISTATEIYNAAREKGYSVEEAIGESGSMLVVNEGVSFAYDLIKDNVKNESVKSVLEILKNTTTETNKNAWLENNGEKGALSLEGIANTLAVETGVQVITKGAPYLLGKLAKSVLA